METSQQEAIGQVIEFTGLDPVDDRELVIQALKQSNWKPDSVVSQYYENQDGFRAKYKQLWDDSMFTADRDGSDNTTGISFHVESSDHNIIQGVTPPSESHAYGAPSRPPSRSNNRSPLGTMVDWTAAHVPGNSLGHPHEYALTRTHTGVPESQAQEDDDMQRAIRASAQEAGLPVSHHESGIIGTSEPPPPHFGPANRETYVAADWAIVQSDPMKESSVNEFTPSKRKRAPGAPAMLVISSAQGGEHRLGGLLTVLHEIPLARNILLGIGSPATTYGCNNDWWRGQIILSPEVLAKMAEEGSSDPSVHKSGSAFEDEVHRLMAFLDSTERGYGSVSVLADILADSDKQGMEKQFYEMLGKRYPDVAQPMMQVAGVSMFYGDDEEEVASFGLLEIEHFQHEYSYIKTLYEALDHVMWSDTVGLDKIHDGSKMAFFKKMGDVLVLDTTGDGPSDSFEIPLEFYPERYLMNRKDEARRIQHGWCQTKEQTKRILDKKEQLVSLAGTWGDATNDKGAVLKKAIDQWEGYRSYLESFLRFKTLEKSGFDIDKYPDYRTAPPDVDDNVYLESQKVTDVIDYSESLLVDLETKMKGLDVELEQITAKQRALGRLLTVPDKPSRPKPMSCKRYLLRGLVASSSVLYVCQREEADLIDLSDVETKPRDQWWRLAYTPYGDQAVRAEKTTIDIVLVDIWKDTKKPLLVYATEDALGTPKDHLSSQLERFIKVENKAFRQELSKEESTANESKQMGNFESSSSLSPHSSFSPSKRKHRSDSGGSMDSNRASIGSDDDRNRFDNPFLPDDDERVGTEMTDYVHSFTDMEGHIPDSLTGRTQDSTAPTEPTSATMTPSTVTADYLDTNTAFAAEEPRSPEMQEKARPPPFMSLSRNSSMRAEPTNLMDMDIPDEKS
ncbi:hypothetical protein FOPG_06128 [Fusarium oxysporum f. sp. conglutinans race 2 54008]|uniref:Ubiquitin interaction domain-containing protein n=4 Tax=Fusarium oxysporum f. sp. conglutinans TaxID=100902 RepID=A0A8H6LL66_FUSOX|nr:hypothetical protein FOXB_08904 [Fusarium oxysporum f. sp. conglutinans Fo5176]EXL80178.1 hypothetical protein FOPG_06128 [Fusarium oxysporum f. sp. conglutinans race 2 54008]EXL80179.1 hypothetical protein FOPG_06128 [Fusarium oxysporum f. sp. conglutinans race 2 54008]KAF6523698.1 hypothetical protein HZS61_012197 [Fusarium oxysporum f. sp. conglutinans]KAG6985089.1 hypothetical protein FocnCong_v005205 [Fusarium oxysporum f. sp. conglutinans]